MSWLTKVKLREAEVSGLISTIFYQPIYSTCTCYQPGILRYFSLVSYLSECNKSITLFPILIRQRTKKEENMLSSDLCSFFTQIGGRSHQHVPQSHTKRVGCSHEHVPQSHTERVGCMQEHVLQSHTSVGSMHEQLVIHQRFGCKHEHVPQSHTQLGVFMYMCSESISLCLTRSLHSHNESGLDTIAQAIQTHGPLSACNPQEIFFGPSQYKSM